jgi:hypothetical protein
LRIESPITMSLKRFRIKFGRSVSSGCSNHTI